MVTPEYRSNNNAGASNGSNRQEFAMNDIGYERTGGCFVSYRKIAFAFVFVLAVIIAAAFIGVHLSMPQDNGVSMLMYICGWLSCEENVALTFIRRVILFYFVFLRIIIGREVRRDRKRRIGESERERSALEASIY